MHSILLQQLLPPDAFEKLPPTNFTWVDWAIVAVYLAGSVIIGIWANKHVSKLSDFLVAGRSIRLYLGIATMTGTEIGLVTLMYQGNAGYLNGLSALHVGVVWGLGGLLVGLTGFVIYRLRELGVMTIPEFYGRRYNVNVRWIGGLILAAAGILNMGLFLRLGADFVMAVTGLESEAWLVVVMTTLMVLVLIYTVLGGMVSIVVTDLIQFIMLSLGMLVVTAFVVADIGWSDIFRISAEAQGEKSLNPLQGEGYGPLYLVSMLLTAVSAAALWQSGTLRALSAKDPQTAKRIYAWSSITFMARFVIPAFWGVCAFVFLTKSPELMRFMSTDAEGAAGLLKPSQAMPLMIGHVVPTVVLGIIVAAMMAAFMSTHDSYLLCWASVLTQDVVAPLTGDRLSNRGRMRWTRVFIVLQGVFLLVWGLYFPAPKELWGYMAVTGSVYLSGASAVIVLGLYWKRASSVGAVASLLCGTFAASTILKGFDSINDIMIEEAAAKSDSLFQLSIWLRDDVVMVSSFGLAWAAMIVFSLLFPDEPREEVE